jgi:hypothetical protein
VTRQPLPEESSPDAKAFLKRGRTCVFCGAAGPLTKEHVFGGWLSRLALVSDTVLHRSGPLNSLGKELGTGPMFGRTVRNVCFSCNSGWMSDLEQVAQRVFGPLILGEPGVIAPEDHGALAQWAQKTALVAMLVSSEADRAAGYGLSESEYWHLYELRNEARPLPASTLWLGKYTGQTRQAVVWVTPLVVELEDLPEPTRPHGYAVTIALGQLVIHAVRFTTPGMDVEMATRQGMSQLWPPQQPSEWPSGVPVDDESFLDFVAGKDIQVGHSHLRLAAWKPAANLPPSALRGSMVELPALCGKHVLLYPQALVHEAIRGRFHAFVATCECEQVYLIHTEADGAHCRASGPKEYVASRYDALPGVELVIENDNGAFECKRLTA